jgi:hypothetical protein
LSKYTNFKNQNLGTSLLFLSQKCFVQVTQDCLVGVAMCQEFAPQKNVGTGGVFYFSKEKWVRRVDP